MAQMPERMLRTWACREGGMAPKRRSSCMATVGISRMVKGGTVLPFDLGTLAVLCRWLRENCSVLNF